MAKLTLIVNGRRTTVEADPETPLLYVLRNDLGLRAAKFGCGLGQCGACTVLLKGREVRSCVMPVRAATLEPITTLVPAALANAIFNATGVRLRSVPLTPAKLKAAL